jgi:hypothetical protein
MVYRDGRKIDSAEESREEDDSETALIPKSLVAGYDLKAGDSIKLKVVSIMDDEVEVQYQHAGGDESEDKEEESKKPQEEEMSEELVADA